MIDYGLSRRYTMAEWHLKCFGTLGEPIKAFLAVSLTPGLEHQAEAPLRENARDDG